MPEVVTGPRGHDAYPHERSGFKPSEVQPSSEYVVFHSKHRYFNLTLSAKRAVMIEGELVDPGNPRVQFDDGAIMLHKVNDAAVIEKLSKHRLFGLPHNGGYFWFPKMREEHIADEKALELLESLQDPQVQESLRKKAGAEDFAVISRVMDLLTKPAGEVPEDVAPAKKGK